MVLDRKVADIHTAGFTTGLRHADVDQCIERSASSLKKPSTILSPAVPVLRVYVTDDDAVEHQSNAVTVDS
jgi:hypothetical protein